MDTAQWPQKHVGIASQELGDPAVEKRAGKEEALKCPRCNSCNTKFCYYNNYSLTQPRYFCKTCRRYWTQGGTLRSVPVGGGSRKNKRSTATATSSSTNSSLSKKQVAITLPQPPLNNNYLSNEDTTYLFRTQNPSFVASSELSLGGSYVPTVSADLNNNVSNMFSSLLFPFQEFKPTLNYFAYDNNHHHHQGLIANNGVHQEMKLVDGFDQINQDHQGGDRDSIGLLNNGMLSAGGVWQL